MADSTTTPETCSYGSSKDSRSKKVILIVGASRGIGLGLAELFSQDSQYEVKARLSN
jgi:short-subunit dehydrogenase